MNKEEYIKMMKNDKISYSFVKFASHLMLIETALMEKGIINEKDYDKKIKENEDEILEDKYEQLTTKELEQLETLNFFNSMFKGEDNE